jgi:hypothetical protein
MTEATSIRTIALVCPECGERIRSARGDVVYACPRCRSVSEATERGMRTHPCVWPAPGPDREADLRLAFFCFHVEVEYEGEDAKAVDQLTRMVRPDRVYVPAFRQRSVLVFGDMGLAMTYDPPGYQSGEPGRFSGATLGSTQASRLVEPMVLWRADQIHDITDVGVDVRVTGVRVVAVPACDEGGTIVDLLSAKRWPEAAFLDVGSLRFATGG